MNPTRVAQLLRELAEAIEEQNEVAAAPVRKARKAPMLTRPDGEASDAVAGQARKILRMRGMA